VDLIWERLFKKNVNKFEFDVIEAPKEDMTQSINQEITNALHAFNDARIIFQEIDMEKDCILKKLRTRLLRFNTNENDLTKIDDPRVIGIALNPSDIAEARFNLNLIITNIKRVLKQKIYISSELEDGATILTSLWRTALYSIRKLMYLTNNDKAARILRMALSQFVHDIPLLDGYITSLLRTLADLQYNLLQIQGYVGLEQIRNSIDEHISGDINIHPVALKQLLIALNSVLDSSDNSRLLNISKIDAQKYQGLMLESMLNARDTSMEILISRFENRLLAPSDIKILAETLFDLANDTNQPLELQRMAIRSLGNIRDIDDPNLKEKIIRSLYNIIVRSVFQGNSQEEYEKRRHLRHFAMQALYSIEIFSGFELLSKALIKLITNSKEYQDDRTIAAKRLYDVVTISNNQRVLLSGLYNDKIKKTLTNANNPDYIQVPAMPEVRLKFIGDGLLRALKTPRLSSEAAAESMRTLGAIGLPQYKWIIKNELTSYISNLKEAAIEAYGRFKLTDSEIENVLYRIVLDKNATTNHRLVALRWVIKHDTENTYKLIKRASRNSSIPAQLRSMAKDTVDVRQEKYE